MELKKVPNSHHLMLLFRFSIACTHLCPNIFILTHLNVHAFTISTFMASNARYLHMCLSLAISTSKSLIYSIQNQTPVYSSLSPRSVLPGPLSANANHILNTFIVSLDFSYILTSDPSSNPVTSTFKTHVKSDCFLQPPLLLLRYGPASFLIWVTAIITSALAIPIVSSPVTRQS